MVVEELQLIQLQKLIKIIINKIINNNNNNLMFLVQLLKYHLIII